MPDQPELPLSVYPKKGNLIWIVPVIVLIMIRLVYSLVGGSYKNPATGIVFLDGVLLLVCLACLYLVVRLVMGRPTLIVEETGLRIQSNAVLGESFLPYEEIGRVAADEESARGASFSSLRIYPVDYHGFLATRPPVRAFLFKTLNFGADNVVVVPQLMMNANVEELVELIQGRIEATRPEDDRE